MSEPLSERALAEFFGGFDGGWPFWLAGLALLEQAIARSRDREPAFCSYAKGELRRFLFELEAAANLLGAGVELQDRLNADASPADRRGVAEQLLEQVRALASRYPTG